jgi:Fur family transcriptional regulator, stress-responsive regulator
MSQERVSALRRAGLRVTEQRLAVLELLERWPHAAADEIVRKLTPRFGSISAQTTYGVLAALEASGLVRRIELPGSSWRYETRVNDNHHHLVCRKCGRVEDVDCVIGTAPCLEPSDERGFVIEEAAVVFIGLCAGCAAADAPV